MKKPKNVFYSCGVFIDHELGEDMSLEGSMPLYTSIKELKQDRQCWTQCGIVRLTYTYDYVKNPESWPSEKEIKATIKKVRKEIKRKK